jgi:nucleoside-diphosphate-sugar epimerase
MTMKVFVAGATGAIGQQLVPKLVDGGHEVHGMTRTMAKQQLLRDMGAEPVVADALDADQVAEAVARAQPDVIVHELTAIGPMDLRHFDRAFATTNRLRTQGTDHLLSAGQAVGVERFVAQSFFAAYERTGGPVKSEDDSFGPHPPKEMRETVAAIRHVEDAVLAATWTEGIVLRYGGFYGPGTSLGPDGEQTEAVRRRRFPLVGKGSGVWSFIHIADAAEATVAAVEHGRRGVYNIVDDEPAPVAEWLPFLARTLGAKRPMHVPRLVGRLLTGEVGDVMMTELRGASNHKAKGELGWTPSHSSWREGFVALAGHDSGRPASNAA